MTEPIGDIGARDQLDTAIGQLTRNLATYYHGARAAGLPPRVALAALLEYQHFLLMMSAQTHGQYG